MSIREFQPSRAVEVIVIRKTRDDPKAENSYGSGYRIGGRLVLTAAHLLDNVGSYCEVRDKRSFGKEKAQVVWKAQGLDLALIELPEDVEGVEAIVLGKLPEGKTGEKIAFQMYGYPGWGWTQRGQGSAASGLQIEGTIYLADTSPDSLLVLRIDENLASEYSEARVIQAIKENSQEPKSEWRGMSGAAVTCDGLVVAVQTQHPRPMQPNHVEATPLGTVYADEQWRQVLNEHGINPEPEIVRLVSLEGQAEIDFQPYLRSIIASYDEYWWRENAFIDEIEDAWFEFILDGKTKIKKKQSNDSTDSPKAESNETKEITQDNPKTKSNEIEEITQPILRLIEDSANQKILIVGSPGAGKSTLLKKLVLDTARKAQQNDHSLIPVLVELKSYSDTGIKGLILESLGSHDPTLPENAFNRLCTDNRLLLLADGLNELTNDRAKKELKDLCRHQAVIVTSRNAGDWWDIDHQKIDIQPLTLEQIRQFLETRLTNRDRTEVEKLGSRIHDFGKTPLMVWMLYSIFQSNRKTPETRGEAYRSFTALYVERAKEGIQLSEFSSSLSKLAFEMLQTQKPNDSTQFRLDTDEVSIQNLLGSEKDLKKLLNFHLLQTSGAPGNRRIRFCHQSLQEYYAAEELLKRLPSLTDEQLKQDYLNYLKWQESIAIMLGLIHDEDQALRFVKLGLEVSPILGSTLAGKVLNQFQSQAVEMISDLGLPSHVLANLLGETHFNAAIPVLEKFLKGGSWQTRDRLTIKTAISALKRIGTEATIPVLEEALQRYGDRDIVEALASIGSNSALDMLLQAGKHPDKDIRSCVADELGQFKSDQAINVLGNLLEDEDSFVNARAVDSLKKIGNNSALNLLIQSVRDPSNPSRIYAIHALGEIASETYVPILIRELQDQDIYVRWAIIKALENIGSEEAIATLHQIASKDPDLSCRDSANSALQRLRDNEPPPKIAIEDSTFEGLFPPDKPDTCGSTIKKDWGIPIDKIEPILIHILREGISALQNSGYYQLPNSIDDLYTDFIFSVNSDNEAQRISATALEKIGSPENLSQLWQLQKGNSSLSLLSTIAAINDRCGYFNHEIFVIKREKLKQQSEKQRVMTDPMNEGIHITHHYEVNTEVFQVVEKNAGNVIGKQSLDQREKGDRSC
jgi:HEAT repeat protein